MLTCVQIKKVDLNDTYRTLHSKTEEPIFFPNVHKAFIKINHLLHHRVNLNIFPGIDIILNMITVTMKFKK